MAESFVLKQKLIYHILEGVRGISPEIKSPAYAGQVYEILYRNAERVFFARMRKKKVIFINRMPIFML